MKRMLVGFSALTVLATVACAPIRNQGTGSGSSLSSVTLGEFKTEKDKNEKPWVSGRLSFIKDGSTTATIEKTFTAGNGEFTDLKVPYGTYKITLEYFEDAERKTLLYKECPIEADGNKLHQIFVSDYPATVFICDKDGKPLGPTEPVANNVTVKVERKNAGAAAGTGAATGTGAASGTGTGTNSGTNTGSTNFANAAVYTISSTTDEVSKSVTVSATIISELDKTVYCYYRPLITFQGVEGNFGKEVPTADMLLKKGSMVPMTAKFTGMDVLKDATKTPVVKDLKVYGICRESAELAKSDFAKLCTTEASVGCDSIGLKK